MIRYPMTVDKAYGIVWLMNPYSFFRTGLLAPHPSDAWYRVRESEREECG